MAILMCDLSSNEAHEEEGNGQMKFAVKFMTCALAFAASLCFEAALSASQIALFATFILAHLIGYGESMWEAASSAKKMAPKASA